MEESNLKEIILRFSGSFNYELEIDSNDIKDLDKFLNTIGDNLDDVSYIYLELDVDFNGYYDKGRTYGEPENCYPPEFDIEIDNFLTKNNVNVENFLTDKHFEELKDYISINWQDYV